MSLKDIKKEIIRISQIKDSSKCQDAIIKFAKQIQKPRIRSRIRGNYVYFYIMETFYDSDVKQKRERVKENVGRIKKELYEENPDKFRLMSKKELDDCLEQY